MDLITLLNQSTRPPQDRHGLKIIPWNIELQPASSNGFNNGITFDLDLNEYVDIAYISITMLSQTNGLAVDMLSDLNNVEIEVLYNNVSILDGPNIGSQRHTVRNHFNTSFVWTYTAPNFMLSGSGLFPILKRVGSSGRLQVGLNKAGALVETYDFFGTVALIAN